MEWVHCNNCCRQPRSRDNDFIMTSCGHILCKRCETGENTDSCLVCKQKCRITPLSGSMKPEIKMYFEDLETQLNAVCKVARFQKNHRVNLFKKQMRLVESNKSIKMENNLLRKKLLEAEKKIQCLEKENARYLQKTPARISASQPRHPHFSDPRTPAQDVFENTHAAFQHIQPHLRKYNSYRIKVHDKFPERRRHQESNSNNTPADYNKSLPSSSSGFARSFHRQTAGSAFPMPRNSPSVQISKRTQKGPTPPYNALKIMNINELRRNRRQE